MKVFPIAPILNSFVEKDWPRTKDFWFRGIWKFLPFVVFSKRRLYNMHFDVADHAVYHTITILKERETVK